MTADHRSQRERILLAATVALAVPFAFLVLELDPRWLLILFGVVITVLAVGVEVADGVIPRVLRPSVVCFGALTVGALGIFGLSDGELGDYVGLWFTQFAGLVAGLLLIRNIGEQSPLVRVNRDRLLVACRAAFGFFLLMALAYFATAGIPGLGSGLEQSRVDAAQGGTGYIRMFAFLLPTVTILLVALEGKRAWLAVAVSLVFMLGVGNRIPFVYFLFPLVCLVAISGSRLGSFRLMGFALLLVLLVGTLGAYRISTQDDLRKDPNYRLALATGDFAAVGIAAVEHYAEVVPENQLLVKSLVDSNVIEHQYGSTYLTLFVSALPGRQVSPDMMLKEARGRDFVGGGIPPTLAGEGYMNFGYLGVFLNSIVLMLLLRFWAGRVRSAQRDGFQLRIAAAIYGYVVTWGALTQVSGFAGSATVSLAGFLLLVVLRYLSMESGRVRNAG